MANGINLDDYLDYLDQKNARNLGSTATTGLAINQGLSARESDNAALQEDPWKTFDEDELEPKVTRW